MTIVQLNTIKEHAGKLTIQQLADKTGLSYHKVYHAHKNYNLPTTRKTLSRFIDNAKQLRVMMILKALHEGPQSIHGLAILVDASIKTIYRYFDLLEEIGVELHKKSGRYYITQCPICKSQNH